MFKIFKIFSGSDIPFIIEKNFISSEAEEGFIFFNLISEMNFSVAVTRWLKSVAEEAILSHKIFVIESHPVSLFLDGVDFLGIWVAHDISNLNYYGLNKEWNKIYLILFWQKTVFLNCSTNYRAIFIVFIFFSYWRLCHLCGVLPCFVKLYYLQIRVILKNWIIKNESIIKRKE